jgi:polysaccharide deacetylase family protein (PEP-CTERM system associated)
LNLLGIDFEDWYHPELMKPYISGKDKNPTVINGIDKILELLRKNETLATFFLVGELLLVKPELQDKILDEGHEIAFHTMYHTRLDSEGYKEKFSDEIKNFEKLTSGKSKGFRAPTFSLNDTSSWAIDILRECDYQYDSSVVPAKGKMYGLPNALIEPYRISSSSIENDDPDSDMLEFPLLVTKFLGKKIPAGGGFYLRTLPMRIIKNAIRKYEDLNIPATFYIHSWELTPEFFPKISMSKRDEFVTYHNIEKAYGKMDEILENFQFTSFDKYLQNQS